MERQYPVRTFIKGHASRWYIVPDIGTVVVVSGHATEDTVIALAKKILNKIERPAASVRVLKDVAFLLRGDIGNIGDQIPKTLFKMRIGDKVVLHQVKNKEQIEVTGSLASDFFMEVGAKDSQCLGYVSFRGPTSVMRHGVWCTPDGKDAFGNTVLTLDPD